MTDAMSNSAGCDWVKPYIWMMSLDELDGSQRKAYERNGAIQMPKLASDQQKNMFDYALRKGDLIFVCSDSRILHLVQINDDKDNIRTTSFQSRVKSRTCETIADARQDVQFSDMSVEVQVRDTTFLRITCNDFDKIVKNSFSEEDQAKIQMRYKETRVEARYWWMIADKDVWEKHFNKELKELHDGYEVDYNLSQAPYAFYGCREDDKIIGYTKSPRNFACSLLHCSSSLQGDKIFFKKDKNLNRDITLVEMQEHKVLKNVTGRVQGSLFALTPDEYAAFMELSGEGNQGIDNEQISWAQPITGRPRNRITFGAPGTGKSFSLNNEACRHKNGQGSYENGYFEDENREVPLRYERVTFYPTYSYAQFVGTYKPVMKPIIGKDGKEKQDAKGNVKEDISYEFVPGPFLRMLVKALNEPEKNWCLIIEEINRANAAAVFGDVFQLLDRGSDGDSEYAIAASEDIKKHLKRYLEGKGKSALTELTGSRVDSDGDVNLKIPRNMYIWATMNSADQGVFPMDTAFKRRWEFEYVGINAGEEKVNDWIVPSSEDDTTGDDKAYKWINGKNNKWNNIRKFINRLLTISKVNEDKLMGPFFVKADAEKVVSAEQFESKVLMYLWEDAARMCRTKLFKKVDTYSELIAKWKDKGPKMFKELMSEDVFVSVDVEDSKGELATLWHCLMDDGNGE